MTADSVVDVYSSHAAFSILASALLPETSGDHQFRDKKAPEQQTTWDLGVSINDFYYLSRYRDDRQKLLRCGTTIGISHLREREHANLQHIDVLGDVARRLLTSYIAGLSQSRQFEHQPDLDEEEEDASLDRTTRVFIIRPTQSSMFAPETLFKDLLEFPLFPSSLGHGMEMSESRAISLLDRVQLLPVHDFSSAAQAINQVSDALSHVCEQYNRRRPGRRSPSIDNEVDGRDIKYDILQPSLSSSSPSSSSSSPPTALLMIEGLDTLAEDVIHSSNPMRGSAILTPILRTLNHLSRLHASFLSIVVINTTMLSGGGSKLSQQQTLPLNLPASQSSSSTQTHNVHENRVPATTGGLHSAFAREYVHHRPQVNLAGEQSLLNTLLSRTLDQGIDVHLLLQTVGEQTLVEVIKDRVGDGLGKWCVWS